MRIVSLANPTFLVLTTTDAWLTAPELMSLLEQHSYSWPDAVGSDPAQRLAYVLGQLHTLRDAHGQLAFASLEILGPDGRPVRVYKQARLMRGT